MVFNEFDKWIEKIGINLRGRLSSGKEQHWQEHEED